MFRNKRGERRLWLYQFEAGHYHIEEQNRIEDRRIAIAHVGPGTTQQYSARDVALGHVALVQVAGDECPANSALVLPRPFQRLRAIFRCLRVRSLRNIGPKYQRSSSGMGFTERVLRTENELSSRIRERILPIAGGHEKVPDWLR